MNTTENPVFAKTIDATLAVIPDAKYLLAVRRYDDSELPTFVFTVVYPGDWGGGWDRLHDAYRLTYSEFYETVGMLNARYGVIEAMEKDVLAVDKLWREMSDSNMFPMEWGKNRDGDLIPCEDAMFHVWKVS